MSYPEGMGAYDSDPRSPFFEPEIPDVSFDRADAEKILSTLHSLQLSFSLIKRDLEGVIEHLPGDLEDFDNYVHDLVGDVFGSVPEDAEKLIQALDA